MQSKALTKLDKPCAGEGERLRPDQYGKEGQAI